MRVYASVCVSEREREKESVSVCERERERENLNCMWDIMSSMEKEAI